MHRLIAQIPQLFARGVERVTRERDRFARIIGVPAGKAAVNRQTVVSNQAVKTFIESMRKTRGSK